MSAGWSKSVKKVSEMKQRPSVKGTGLTLVLSGRISAHLLPLEGSADLGRVARRLCVSASHRVSSLAFLLESLARFSTFGP